jgi:primosomal protein N'
MMKIITVIPLKKALLHGDLTYFTSLNISVGGIVSVPIRSKKTLALVTSSEELKEEKSNIKKMDFHLKKVSEDKGISIFLQEYLDSIFETSKYFAQNIAYGIPALIPNIFIEEYDKIDKIKDANISLINDKSSQKFRAEKLLFQYPLQNRISVYKTLIRESFAKGESVFMVLPTSHDIDKFYGQLSKGIEQFAFLAHGGINGKKNLATYEKIMTATHPVFIIGTPPFLSIPKKNIGTVILEHENSNTYRMQRRPYFDLRVFVEIYSSKINAKFIIADELLRFETIGRKDIENLNALHPLSFRVDFGGKIEVFGRETKKEGRRFRILNDESVEEIKYAMENKKNVFIFSLRKGLATMTVCKDCGETVSCEKCGAPLVLYMSYKGKERMFVCNRCTNEKSRDTDDETVCAHCGGWNLMQLGIGTDTVYEEVQRIFSKNNEELKIFQLDKESAKTAARAKKIIKDFEDNPGSILIGTEMAFFYLRGKVPLSVIASFDSLRSIPNFKMGERIIQIMLSMIGNTSEKLIIQTKNENDEAVVAIKSENLLFFAREELEEREKMEYPPFKRFIKITFAGDKEQTVRAKKMLEEILKEYQPEIFSGFIARQEEKYVTNALIRLDREKWSLPELSPGSSIDENLHAKILSLPPNFVVFVDPEDLL